MIQFKNDIKKVRPTHSAIVRQLLSFLNRKEPQLAFFLVRLWRNQQQAITYKELRDAIISGGIDSATLEAWRQDYSKFINEALKPIWNEAMQEAAQQLLDRYPDYLYNPNAIFIKAWVEQRAAELVVDITQEQRTAINALVQRATQIPGQSVDSLARAIRPTVGLYPQQAVANMKHYERVKENLLKTNPQMKTAAAEVRALKASTKYAEVQHRYRANMIARTEIVNAYNQGELGAVKQAVADGLIGPVKKRWSTAYDERVCDKCKWLEGVEVELDELFPGGHEAPTAHPHCRCVLMYIEQEGI